MSMEDNSVRPAPQEPVSPVTDTPPSSPKANSPQYIGDDYASSQEPKATLREQQKHLVQETLRGSPTYGLFGTCSRILRFWWAEFLGCLLMLAAIFALIGTVYPYEGRPLPDWPYRLSINTLISIYTVIFDMALVMVVSASLGQLKYLWFREAKQLSDMETFDQGGKGPWGALMLLWTLRTRNKLASVGALIVTLTVLTAPFSQQVVRYYSCLEIDPSEPATIPWANVSSCGDPDGRAGNSEFAVSMLGQVAISSGLFEREPALVSPYCPTRNCTFTDEYVSAGYCGVCEDWTDRIVYEEPVGGDARGNFTIPDWDIYSDVAPDSFVIGTTRESSRPTARIIYGIANQTWYEQAGEQCEGGITGGDWKCLEFGAAECSVIPCTRRYKASVQQGELTEEILSTNTEYGSMGGEDPYIALAHGTADVQCLNLTEREFLSSSGYDFDDNTEWLGANGSHLENVRRECTYWSYNSDMNGLITFFGSFFPGSVVGVSAGGLSGDGGGSMAARALWNRGELNFTFISTKFDHVGTSLTTYTRQGQPGVIGNKETYIYGDILTARTCVAVQWPWVTLEAVLLLLTFGFFATVIGIVATTDNEAVNHNYKTSVLPLLYHGVDGESVDRYMQTSQTWNASRIKDQAKTVRVKLVRNTRGWGFAEASE